jgi:hypothetical protein
MLHQFVVCDNCSRSVQVPAGHVLMPGQCYNQKFWKSELVRHGWLVGKNRELCPDCRNKSERWWGVKNGKTKS